MRSTVSKKDLTCLFSKRTSNEAGDFFAPMAKKKQSEVCEDERQLGMFDDLNE